MLDRTIQPASESITFQLPSYETVNLDNQIPCYVIHGSQDPVLRLEFVFNAGEVHAYNPLVAMATNRLLEEGTQTRNSMQIADELDFYGAYLHLNVDKESASITLYCLSHHLEKTLPVFVDILQNANFPEEELTIYLNNARQRYLVNQEKVSVLSKRQFMSSLFGTQSAYGRVIEWKDYDDISRDHLVSFYKDHYHPALATLFLSGNINSSVIETINRHIGVMSFGKPAKQIKSSFVEPIQKVEHSWFVPKKDAVQSSIRMGCISVSRTHPDYIKLQLLNTVLGGYFGSRLMANIREDKGYTYGIGSSLVSLKNAGFFMISTEVGCEYVGATLKEIKHELDVLCKELIPEDELEKVRNYMLGSLLRGFDGPFEISDRLKTCIHYGQNFSFYKYYIDELMNSSPESLKQLANTYFKPNLMIEVVAGQK